MNVTVHINPIGMIESKDYQWVGDSPYILVDTGRIDNMWPPPQKLSLGAYKLKKVEDRPAYSGALYVISDRFYIIRTFVYKLIKLIDLIYRRMIITLAVWNLADYHGGTIPSWVDIKIVKRIRDVKKV